MPDLGLAQASAICLLPRGEANPASLPTLGDLS